jgi:hypothetical protein
VSPGKQVSFAKQRWLSRPTAQLAPATAHAAAAAAHAAPMMILPYVN